MSVILVFLLVILGISAWWLSQQRLMSKPWLEQGAPPAVPGAGPTGIPTAKIALAVLLAVVGALFALFASASFMRMELSDWQTPPLPPIVWLNTAILLASSVALQVAVSAVRRGRRRLTRDALVSAGLTAVAFLVGQLMAWRELAASGYLVDTNPANSFFYLLTGLHGLHIVGGLVGLTRTSLRAWKSERVDASLRLGVELCAMYWHFLLFVWIALLVLLAGWAGEIAGLSGHALT